MLYDLRPSFRWLTVLVVGGMTGACAAETDDSSTFGSGEAGSSGSTVGTDTDTDTGTGTSMSTSATTTPTGTGTTSGPVECGNGFIEEDEQCDDGNMESMDGCSSTCELEATVGPYYPANGADWNDYIINDGTTVFESSGDVCPDDTVGDYKSCIHAGEMRSVEVGGRMDCGAMTASDTLDAFDWVCDDSGDPVRFVSVGLKDGYYLSDLLDFTAVEWRPNSVTVMDGADVVVESASTPWWTNTVASDNDGGVLSEGGAIVLVTSDPQAGYEITANKIALVVDPGIVMQGPGNDNMITADSRRFLWIEGTLDGVGDDRGFSATALRFSVLRGFHISGAEDGIYLASSPANNMFMNVSATANSNTGFRFTSNPDGNWFVHATAAGNDDDGFDIASGSDRNTMIDVIASSNIDDGIRFSTTATDNTFIQLTSNGNGGDGFSIASGSHGNLAIGVSSVNNTGGGVILSSSSSRNTFMNLLTANNGSFGFQAGTSSHNLLFINLATLHNGDDGITLASCNNGYFSGVVKVGQNSGQDCDINGGTLPGITDACQPNGASDFTLSSGTTVANSIRAKVTSTDTVNGSNTNGQQNIATLTDWAHFEHRLRGWGREGTLFPNVNQRGACTIGTCRIWDFGLRSQDAVIRNAAPAPGGNDVVDHVASDNAVTTILRHAMEIVDDRIGNDDGLCESNEACLYLPNVASYPGHGAIGSGPVFVNGTLFGVTLLEHAANGY